MPRSASRRRTSAAAAPAETDRAALAGELVDRAGQRRHVQLAERVLAERRQLLDVQRLQAHVGGLAARRQEAPDLAAAEVAVEVAARRGRNRRAAVDVPARDRAAVVAVVVDDDRPDEPPARRRLLPLREDGVPLVDAPAEVRQPEAARQDVHLLPRALTDVSDVELARRRVEREAPRVPGPVNGVRPVPGLVAEDLAE